MSTFARRCVQGGLLLGHAGLGALIIATVVGSHLDREAEVAELRATATEEAAATASLRRQVEVEEARLEGLRDNDPYAVELLARTRLGWEGPHEVRPPPAPAATTP